MKEVRFTKEKEEKVGEKKKVKRKKKSKKQ